MERATGSSGLSEAEAKERLRSHGFNELPAAMHKSVLRIFLRVLLEPMLLLLVACGVIYMLMGEPRDGMLLFASAVLVIWITLAQEVKSERALEALRDLSSPRALVIRGGVERRVPGREVVPGDLIRVAEGDRVPADARLISTPRLAVDESLLTGESFSVNKQEEDRLYSGTLVVSGQGLADVVETGARTELGKIGRSLRAAKESATPLQTEVNRMVRVFGSFGIGFSIAIALVYGITRGDWPQGILAGLAAAMSLLPEEFPVVMTVFLAMGAWRISKKRVLTRRVAAIEALGSISALCVDKTGTLTQNRMSVRDLAGGAPESETGEVLEFAALACHENPFDPMEKAILAAAGPRMRSGGMERERTRVRQYPLSSGLMAMSVAWKDQSNQMKDPASSDYLIAAKGAPEAILQLCHFRREETKRVLDQVHGFAAMGRRVLAVARADHPDGALPEHQHDFDFRYVGLLTLEDPIRPEVPSAIRECRNAGIRVIMLTGDYPETARSIASELKLSGKVASGAELSRMDDLRLREAVKSTSVFARVTPDQKLRIVSALRAAGEVVAMTGDGVNDAPSLKWADIGVAMGGRGTDVAREASAIVLLDDSFTSMVAAIRLGRRIYDNLQKAVLFILSVHVPIAGLAMFPVIFGLPLLLLPAHIVFLELIIDPACTLVYEAEQDEPDVMSRKPRAPGAPLVRFKDLMMAGLQGAVVLGLVFFSYVFLLKNGRSPAEARTMAFLALILSNLGLILVNRVRVGGLLEVLRRKNRAFRGVVGGAILLLALILSLDTIHALFAFASLRPSDLGWAITLGAASLFFNNLIRLLVRK